MILIVRHGPGRGRLHPYLAGTLAHIRKHHPRLHERLRLHDTGTRPPPLGDISAVVFWLADPLREFYPACYEEAAEIAAEARRGNLRIINPPEAMSNSIKSAQSRLWLAAGIPTPPVHRFEDPGELRAAADRCGYPLIVRSDEEHVQKGLRVVRDSWDLESVASGSVDIPGAVIPLIDVRESFRRSSPRDVRARFHHKKRAMVLGSLVRTKHMFFADEPIVSAGTCLFNQPLASLLSSASRARDFAECVRKDMAYWRLGTEHETLMRRALEALGLGFAAIDYSDLADGSAVLWEANPFFSLPSEEAIMLPRLRKPRQRIASFHEAIGRFLADLVESSSPAPSAPGGLGANPCHVC